MPELKFYDLKEKEFFTTDKFKLETKKNRKRTIYMACAIAPSGTKSYRIVSKDFYKENK
jgi:hypothetical protein